MLAIEIQSYGIPGGCLCHASFVAFRFEHPECCAEVINSPLQVFAASGFKATSLVVFPPGS